MPQADTLALLLEAQRQLFSLIPNPCANRRLARKIALFLSVRHTIPSGDPVIALAQSRVFHLPRVAIDSEETEARIHADGLEVRAWYLVPSSDLPERQAAHRTWRDVLDALPPATKDVLILSQNENMTIKSVAIALGMSARAARRHLRHAIAHIAKHHGL